MKRTPASAIGTLMETTRETRPPVFPSVAGKQLGCEEVVGRLNRMLSGWANYFNLGQVGPAYRAVDRHAIRRLRQWFCRKHKVRSGKYMRFPDQRLWNHNGLTRLALTTRHLPWAKA